jgi:alpha-amylase
MGECFNGFSGYVGDYQNHVSALFNYPMYFSIRDAFANGKSMTLLRDRWTEEAKYFKDIDALGIFVDNHDNARFLNQNGEHRLFKSAQAFALTARGIPFLYYGSEQGFSGGQDPYNREALWNNLDQTSEMFTFIKTIMAARKHAKSYNNYFNEKYVDD